MKLRNLHLVYVALLFRHCLALRDEMRYPFEYIYITKLIDTPSSFMLDN